jgi:hypothetical protein
LPGSFQPTPSQRPKTWGTLTNGDLLAEAERAGFDVLLTADKNMRYQQNLRGRRIAIVVLSTLQWPVKHRQLAAVSIRRRQAKILVVLHWKLYRLGISTSV